MSMQNPRQSRRAKEKEKKMFAAITSKVNEVASTNAINSSVAFNFTAMQLTLAAICAALFLICLVRWLSGKKTGAVDCALAASIPVVLYFSNFFDGAVKLLGGGN